MLVFFVEIAVRYPDKIKEKTKNFPFCPEKRNIHKAKNNQYMKRIKPKNYTKTKNIICDWTDKKN